MSWQTRSHDSSTTAFGQACGQRLQRQAMWFPYTKSGRKSEVKNYSPVSLLPLLSKVVETIVASKSRNISRDTTCSAPDNLGFRQGRSAADLHLLLSSELSVALDQGKKTAVVALNIEGTFYRVRHEAFVPKLRSSCTDGALLPLLMDYLKDRQLRVWVWLKEAALAHYSGTHILTTCCIPSQDDEGLCIPCHPHSKATSLRK